MREYSLHAFITLSHVSALRQTKALPGDNLLNLKDTDCHPPITDSI